MAFKLPDLPYDFNALEPVIDEQTMRLHHGKHHNAYVTKLNDAIQGTEWESRTIDEIVKSITSLPEDIRTAVRNNGGGHWNHAMFWEIMGPKGQVGQPSGELTTAIDDAFGGLDQMKEKVNAAGAGQFGSGWAWVIVNDQGKLQVTSTPNQDNPLMKGIAPVTGTPILGVDVWEHAYYLKYQNKRPDYLTAWWDVVNWNKVNERFSNARR